MHPLSHVLSLFPQGTFQVPPPLNTATPPKPFALWVNLHVWLCKRYGSPPLSCSICAVIRRGRRQCHYPRLPLQHNAKLMINIDGLAKCINILVFWVFLQSDRIKWMEWPWVVSVLPAVDNAEMEFRQTMTIFGRSTLPVTEMKASRTNWHN